MNKRVTEILLMLALVVCHCVFWLMHSGILNAAYTHAYWDTSWQLLKDALYFQHLASYMEGFLLAFFQWKWVGILLLLIPLVLIYLLTKLLLRQVGAGENALLAFIPTIVVMLFQHYEHFFLIKSIVVLLIFAMIELCYLLRNSHWYWQIFLYLLIAALASFLSNIEMTILLGGVLCCNIIFIKGRTRYVYAAISFVLGALFFVSYIEEMDSIPMFQVETPIELASVVLILIVLMSLLKWKIIPTKYSIALDVLSVVFAVSLLGAQFVPTSQLIEREKQGQLDMALLSEDYGKILSLTSSEKQKASSYYPYTIYALAKTGKLADCLFQYPINRDNFIVEAMPPHAGKQSLLNVCYFRSIGLLNEAIHQAFQMGISCEYDDTFLSLQLLADLNIADGNYVLAGKYLSKLDKTLVHGAFVRSRHEIMATTPTFDNRLDFCEYLYVNKDQFMNLGYSLFVGKNDSQFVKDYFLCSLLIMGDYSQFCSFYNQLYPEQHDIPRAYAEALVMARDFELLNTYVSIPRAVEVDWQSFLELSSYSPALLSRFRNTWWYYSTFIAEDIK